LVEWVGGVKAMSPPNAMVLNGGFRPQVVPIIPDEAFDQVDLARLREEAMADTCRLLRFIVPSRSPCESTGCEDEELRVEQERENDEADCRVRVLRVARRQLWRERAGRVTRRENQEPGVCNLSPAADTQDRIYELKSKLAAMDQKASELEANIEQRRVERDVLFRKLEEVGHEVKEWGRIVTSLEAEEQVDECRREAQQEDISKETVVGAPAGDPATETVVGTPAGTPAHGSLISRPCGIAGLSLPTSRIPGPQIMRCGSISCRHSSC